MKAFAEMLSRLNIGELRQEGLDGFVVAEQCVAFGEAEESLDLLGRRSFAEALLDSAGLEKSRSLCSAPAAASRVFNEVFSNMVRLNTCSI